MKLRYLISASVLAALAFTGCGPSAPGATTSDGKPVAGDKQITGAVTGTKVGSSTKIAVFGAFTNVSGNKIDTQNKTISADTTLAVAPVASGSYNFALPKGPDKAQGANFKIFAFNDANGNSTWDADELKSKEASVQWLLVGGYVSAIDPDGNVIALAGNFKDFDFKLD